MSAKLHLNKFALALAALILVRATYGYYQLGTVLDPDFGLYTKPGLGIWPSPGGRALAYFGTDIFARISIGCAALATYVVCSYGGRLAGLAFAFLPLTIWLDYASVDTPALAIFLVGVIFSRTSLTGIASLVHFQLAPYALADLVRKGTWRATVAAGFLSFVFLIALMLTPYSGIVYGIFNPMNIVTYGIIGMPLVWLQLGILIVLSKRRLLVLGTALVAAIECGAQQHSNPRYFLLAFALGCIYLRSAELHSITRAAVGFARVTTKKPTGLVLHRPVLSDLHPTRNRAEQQSGASRLDKTFMRERVGYVPEVRRHD